jgi:polysaccharide biosynthesis protein PslH
MRQFHLLRAYSSVATVDLAYFFKSDREVSEMRAGVGSYCDRLHAFPAPPSRHGVRRLGPWRGLGRMITHPMLADILESTELQRLVRSSAASMDLIHVSRLHLVNAVESLIKDRQRPRLVLDLDDVESVAKQRHLRVTPSCRWVNRLFHYYDVMRISAYERYALRHFDRVLVCSEKDRRMLGCANVVVVPNGIDVPSELPTQERDDYLMLFCGLLSYRPNDDAVRYFISSILPHIQREASCARLLLVGRSPSASLRALADATSVSLSSDVPSVADYYHRASIAIVPLRIAGGTRIKILEAWAFGVPVVTTSIGCEGLDGVNGEHFIVADSPAEFAKACVELMRSPSRRRELASRGRELVRAKYRWEISRRTLNDTLLDVLNPTVAMGATDPS